MCVCVSIYAHKYRCRWSLGRVSTPPELEIQTVWATLAGMDARNGIWVLCKNSPQSQPLLAIS